MPQVAATIAEPVALVQKVNNPDNVQMVAKKENDHLIETLTARLREAKQNKSGDSIAIQQQISAQVSWEYFSNLPQDKRPGAGKEVLLFSTELYQSINPFWVVCLTPIIVGLFGWMRSKKKEPSTPAKIAMGLFITGLSTLVMVAAVKSNAT